MQQSLCGSDLGCTRGFSIGPHDSMLSVVGLGAWECGVVFNGVCVDVERRDLEAL